MPRHVSAMVSAVVMVILVITANVPGFSATDYQYEDDYTESCHPEEADTCFKDVNENLLCNLGKSIPNMNCSGRDARDLCTSMDDALDCCEAIMDSCTESDGLDIFQVWFSGLDGVYSHLCVEDEELGLISDLLQGSNCFRLKKFLTCVEDRANLTHVADLLTTQLDLHECNMLQVSVAACIEDAEKNRRNCRGRADVVKEALIVFFSTTGCGHTPPPLSPLPCIPPTAGTSTTKITSNTTTTNTGSEATTTTTTTNNPISTQVTSIPNQASTSGDTSSTRDSSNNPKCPETKKDLSKSGTPMASTIVVTVLVTLVLVGLTGMVLVKRGVLTIRTDFDRRLTGLNDGETSGGYDRF